MFRSEYRPSKVRFSTVSDMANSGLPRQLFRLSLVALILILTWGCGVEGINFTFNGFKGLSDVYIVPNSGNWTYNPNDSSIFLDPSTTINDGLNSVAGRILYPEQVQMLDPPSMTAKSFSCNFIFQILVPAENCCRTGPGMTFMMVPDNSTLGQS